jgi:Uma2 family endonuclease
MVVQKKTTTTTAFAKFINQRENADRLFELIDGEIVEKVPTEEHGIIAANIVGELKAYLKTHPIGRVAVEVRHQVPGDDQNDRLPDVSFTSYSDRPVVREGAVQDMPDLAVEIKSPGQTNQLMLDKAEFYLEHGSRMVWLIYPDKRLVEVRTHDKRDLLLGEDVIEGGNVLPSFTMKVSDVFADLD